MSYLIIGFILLLILAPILSALPSADQKARMVKRRVAMAASVRVDLTHIDDPDPDPEKYLSNTGKPLERRLPVVAYRYFPQVNSKLARTTEISEADSGFAGPLRVSKSASATDADWQFDRIKAVTTNTFVTDWQSVDTSLTLFDDEFCEFMRTALKRMADDVVRVESKQSLISIYWQERGGAEAVVDFLKSVPKSIT